uniref:DUF4780 domain-containing protein n=1 Tax=Rhodnius prolixus TaxID=13249 RepID=T1HK24_RHOPR
MGANKNKNKNTIKGQHQQQHAQQQSRPQRQQTKKHNHQTLHKFQQSHLEAPNVAIGQRGGADGSASIKAKAGVHSGLTGITEPVRADRVGGTQEPRPGRGQGKGNTPPTGTTGAENPKTPAAKGTGVRRQQSFRADSLEAIEAMTDAEVHSARISGSSKKRVAALTKAGIEYLQAKRPGFVLATCADQFSAEWLRDIVPRLTPWKGAKLLPLLGDDIPRPETAVVFIPDEQGSKIEADIVLKRLEVGNQKLCTGNWNVWGCKPMEGGQVWTFSMDRASLDELRRLNMSPFFGWGQVKFRVKSSKYKGPEKAKASTDEKESMLKATDPDPDKKSTPGWRGGLEGEMEALRAALSELPAGGEHPKEEGAEAMEISVGDLPSGSGSLPQRPSGLGQESGPAETQGGSRENTGRRPAHLGRLTWY